MIPRRLALGDSSQSLSSFAPLEALQPTQHAVLSIEATHGIAWLDAHPKDVQPRPLIGPHQSTSVHRLSAHKSKQALAQIEHLWLWRQLFLHWCAHQLRSARSQQSRRRWGARRIGKKSYAKPSALSALPVPLFPKAGIREQRNQKPT